MQGDRFFWPRQGLFWPYYTVFSVGSDHSWDQAASVLAYLPHNNFRHLNRGGALGNTDFMPDKTN